MKRAYVIDFARTLAILGVVGIHVFGRSLSVGIYDIIRYQLIFFTERLFRFSVPLFFIISGYILMYRYQKPFSVVAFWKKRFIRLGIPYILWTGFYMLFADKFHFSGFWTGEFLGKLTNGTAAVQLYFIPALFLLYLLFPLLKKMQKFFTWHTFILFTVIEFILLTLDYSQVWRIAFGPLRIAVLNLYLFIIGMQTYIHKETLLPLIRKYRFVLIGFLIVTIIIMYRGIFFLFLSTKTLEYMYSQWETLIFQYAILLWFLIIAIPEYVAQRFATGLVVLSRLSFFVFFIHVLYISLFWRFVGSYMFSVTNGKILDQFWFSIFAYVTVLFFSFTSGYIFSKIPLVRGWVGIE